MTAMIIPADFGIAAPAGILPPGFDRLPDLRVWAPGEWALLDELGYTALDGRQIIVPRRFITDLASIPQLAQAVFAIDDESRLPAIVHDLLYCSKQFSRAEADALFLEMLTRAGVGLAKRQAMYAAVRVGGWSYWNRRDGLVREDFALIA